mgnify:CR=1 FL=1
MVLPVFDHEHFFPRVVILLYGLCFVLGFRTLKGRWNRTLKNRFNIVIDEKVTAEKKLGIGEDEVESSG